MHSLEFLYALQLADSFLPVGAFAYSDGLETAVSRGRVQDARDLGIWMDGFLDLVFIPCEGLALAQCMTALREGNVAAVHRIDEELTAIRPALSVRQSSAGVGKRLLSLCSAIADDAFPQEMAAELPRCNATVAYALIFFWRGIDERHALLAFGYSRLAGMVSAGLRLLPMGHQQGQEILTRLLERLPEAVDQITRTKGQPLTCFSPMMDLEQMNHRYVYSRLFRS